MVLQKTLPDGWRWAKLGEIADTTSGGTPSRKHLNYYGGDIPWIKSGELRDGIIYNHEETITPLGLANSSAKIFPQGTVVVALYGATVGRTGILNYSAATNQAICGIFPVSGSLSPLFLFYWLQSQRQNLINLSIGAAQPNISQSIIRNLYLAFPPLSEQERIVAKIEELFTQLDAGVAALKRIQAGLRRYKASVLKAACEGKLATQDAADEPAAEVLRRLGKSPLAGEGLAPLPEGWLWVTTELIGANEKYALKAGPFGSALKKEYYAPNGYKIYGQEQVIRGDPHYGDYYIDEELYAKLITNAVKPGDILISLVGTIGKVLILPNSIEPGIINPRLVKLSLEKLLINNMYFKLYMETSSARHYFSSVSHGETMEILNLSILRRLPIPLPPLAEQQRIVAEVERRLSLAAQVEAAVGAGLKRAARLRQAILKRAFEGKLVAPGRER